MSTSRINIPVSGMTCAACQARVQRALTTVPGVEDATVNLLLHNATVDFDPDEASPEELVAAIRATGYDATLPAANAPNEPTWSAAFAEEAQRERTSAKEERALGWKA